MKKLRNVLVTGLVVLIPLMATVDLLRWFIRSIDQLVREYFPTHFLPFDFPGLGVVIAFFFVFLVGLISQNVGGRWIFSKVDRMAEKIAVIGGIYGGIKKFLETLFSSNNEQFSGVVLVPFPRQGLYSIGFRTGKPDPKVTRSCDEKSLTSVFVPCTPNPTSGFYLLVKEEELIAVDLSVQEAFKIVVSMGLVTTSSEERSIKK